MVPTTWDEALLVASERLKSVPGERVGALAGDLCDAESMFALKELMASLGSANLDCRQDGAALDSSRRDFYTFNSSIAGIEEADAILLIGCNPRAEAPVLNARIRKHWLHTMLPVGRIGAVADMTYAVTELGDGPGALSGLLSSAFGTNLREAKRPMVIVGQGALRRPDGAAVLAAAWKLAGDLGGLRADWHGFNVLHTAAARVGALDLGFVPGPSARGFEAMMGGRVDVLYLLGADEFDTSRIGADTFVIYQGHHGDRGAARADVILPGAAYTEKPGTYVNTEGRVQRSLLAVYPPGEAREDWRIIRALSAVLGKVLPYDTIEALRQRMEQVNPAFARIGFLPRFGISDLSGPAGDAAAVSGAPFTPAVANYYQTDPISRASPTMVACIEAQHGGPLAVAAE
jgi:NADH-quinone oxidoreductase subunit G